MNADSVWLYIFLLGLLTVPCGLVYLVLACLWRQWKILFLNVLNSTALLFCLTLFVLLQPGFRNLSLSAGSVCFSLPLLLLLILPSYSFWLGIRCCDRRLKIASVFSFCSNFCYFCLFISFPVLGSIG